MAARANILRLPRTHNEDNPDYGTERERRQLQDLLFTRHLKILWTRNIGVSRDFPLGVSCPDVAQRP